MYRFQRVAVDLNLRRFNKVDDYKNLLPVIQALLNQAMKHRHWVGTGTHCSPRHRMPCSSRTERSYRPISVYCLGYMPMQSCGQGVSAPRGKAGARMNAHT